ncbi:MAG: tripartite tricarboxylate transporter substrate binding protein [Betaproteobacteria bacterium]|nr:tripartite tricarboxylate transporter substrate binding protein [Betaproteobacteria bacterium]
MQKGRRKAILTIAQAATLPMLAPMTAFAQASPWPNKPIRLIVPFPPGGSIDPLARTFSQYLKELRDWTIVVDNRPGASGSMGTAIAARALPDGYTFLLVFDTHAVNPSLIPTLGFDTLKDLDPVMVIGTSPMVLSTHQSRPYRNVADWLQAVRAKPEAVDFGTVGNGSLGHLSIKILEAQGGFRVVHIPYKGGAPFLADAVAGTLDSFMSSIASQMAHIESGRFRPLAVTGPRRVKQLPNVPTFAESGFPGFSVISWWGMLAPAGTPRPIIETMHREVKRVLEIPAVRGPLEDRFAMNVVAGTPQEMQAFLVEEVPRWRAVVQKYNIQQD